MLEAMTAKELDYISDSMSNEDLLMKQCAAVAASAATPALRQLCSQMVQTHQEHYDSLMQTLSQHQQLAPTQPQQ